MINFVQPTKVAASGVSFNPADTIAATDVQNAIVEALVDARAYSDAVAAGLDPKESVSVATNAALPANTRTGNVLTASADGALTNIDTSYAPVLGARILVKNEATQANNGLYTFTSLGSPSTRWTMTRSTDADTSAKVTSGMYCVASFGTHAAQAWVMNAPDPITLNSSSLTFVPLALLSLPASSVVNTPAGNISSTDIQAAVNELDTEKVAKAGDTMTGALTATGFIAPTLSSPSPSSLFCYSNNCTGSADIGVKVGTSVADASVDTAAKLLSVRTGIAGAEVEKAYISKSGVTANCRSLTTPAVITSSGSALPIDCAASNVFTYTTVENSTLAAPTNAVAGQTFLIVVTQGAVTKTLAYNAAYKWPGGVAPALSTLVGGRDVISGVVLSSTDVLLSMGAGYLVV
jgi:hypothetical protein